jgi:hypothetical protein
MDVRQFRLPEASGLEIRRHRRQAAFFLRFKKNIHALIKSAKFRIFSGLINTGNGIFIRPF